MNTNNIILTWMPGSWKTTLGKKLARNLGYEFCDFDDDILEKINNDTAQKISNILQLNKKWIKYSNLINTHVKDLLSILWDKGFLITEWIVWTQIKFEKPTVFSASGSLPLSLDAMENLKKQGNIVYIDIPIELIVSRLEQMKTDRIVGMWEMWLTEILEYRKIYYDITKDYNFEVPLFDAVPNKNKETREIEKDIIFEQFLEFYNQNIKK